MKTVRNILDAKGRDVWRIAPDESVLDAIRMMSEKSVGALLVMEGARLAGIISERDYARKVILKGKSSEKTPVREIMTTDVVCAAPDESIEDCMRVMTEKRIRHLPVVENETVIGVLSIGDLVKAIIEEQHFTIKQLEMYITG
jgi:Predicted signal-transduction protein containing cAMP-binding and CBS domains